MPRKQNEKSIELRLLQIVDTMVLEPEQKKLAVRAMKQVLHANKVSNIKGLRKAIDLFLGLVLRGGGSDSRGNNDD